MEPADLGAGHTPGIGVEPYTHAGETGSESMWRDTDAVASWSWAGCEGKKTKVTVYSDGETAELIVNGHSYGRKKTKEYKAVFKHVVYERYHHAISYDARERTEPHFHEDSCRTCRTACGGRPEHLAGKNAGFGLQSAFDLTGADGITKSF